MEKELQQYIDTWMKVPDGAALIVVLVRHPNKRTVIAKTECSENLLFDQFDREAEKNIGGMIFNDLRTAIRINVQL